MTPAALLFELERRGVVLVAEHDSLRFRPSSAVPAHLRSALTEHAAAVKRLLLVREGGAETDARAAQTTNEELNWRVEAMLPQVPLIGPIRGLLTARDGAWPADGQHCISCGDPISGSASPTGPLGFSVRCQFCCEAARLAIERGRATR